MYCLPIACGRFGSPLDCIIWKTFIHEKLSGPFFLFIYFVTPVLLVLQWWTEWEFSGLGERLHHSSAFQEWVPHVSLFLGIRICPQRDCWAKIDGFFWCFFSLTSPMFVLSQISLVHRLLLFQAVNSIYLFFCVQRFTSLSLQ